MPHPPFYSQASSNKGLMRDAFVHGCWLVTHFCRTVWERDSTQQAIASLSQEVQVLQAELHRAHRLLEGYNTVLDREGANFTTHTRGVVAFTIIIAILTFLLWISWRPDRPRLGSRASGSKSVTGDTGGSSSEESVADQTVPAALLDLPATRGPLRPSSLGKGKRK